MVSPRPPSILRPFCCIAARCAPRATNATSADEFAKGSPEGASDATGTDYRNLHDSPPRGSIGPASGGRKLCRRWLHHASLRTAAHGARRIGQRPGRHRRRRSIGQHSQRSGVQVAASSSHQRLSARFCSNACRQ